MDHVPGVFYARTDDGMELPVIDVTHPAFRVQVSEAELETAVRKAEAEAKSRQALSAEVRKNQLRTLLSSSFIAPMLAAAQGGVLSGLGTYFCKLGPENLGGYAAPVDRMIAASLPCLSVRLRLQHMARLVADAAAKQLSARREAPLHIVNIAGGPAIDSLNALLLLRHEKPSLLGVRAIVIHVLDPDSRGPAFGMRALEALRGPGAPLERLDLRMSRIPYDWADPSPLRDLLDGLEPDSPLIIGSSEGGLLEYGSDEEMVQNLGAFRGSGAFFAGTVTRSDGAARVLNSAGGAALHLRAWADFEALIRGAGWRVMESYESPLSRDVILESTT